MEIPRPRSRSSSTSSSTCSGSPLALDPSVLELLNSHLTEKAEEEARFKALEAEHVAARLAGLDVEDDDAGREDKPMISLDDYKKTFGEDWQLSQFWYSNEFADHLSTKLHGMCTRETKIAFMCSPTAFVSFQHMKQLPGAHVFEVDSRFAALSPRQFVPYDLDSPDDFPKKFQGFFDIVVVDPPFLNEVTNVKVSSTIRQIIKPKGKLLLITSTSIEDIFKKVYSEPPLGPLRKTALDVQHGQLANDFASWGNWDGAEEFGRD
ncbi:hypothetical protein D9611_014542 [Ephemerocybe angulata]|uniref:Protein-lysine N-methyltransferase n=1 Tax=Ephemerocybe angulata TaxID=980116 RepID=A0A8H5BS07_9AGAR|nr:hypothetical protein D9611_014542 [Tulosesus angulatus]